MARQAKFILVLSLWGVLLCGCKKPPPVAPPSAAASAEPSQEPPTSFLEYMPEEGIVPWAQAGVGLVGRPPKGQVFKVGFALAAAKQQPGATILAAAQQEAKRFPYLKLVPRDAQGNSATQLKDLRELTAGAVDLLIVHPVTPDALAPVLDKLSDQELPTILLEHPTKSGKYTCCLSAAAQGEGAGGQPSATVFANYGSGAVQVAAKILVDGPTSMPQRIELPVTKITPAAPR